MDPITSPKDLGRVLRRYRKEKGLSQTQVGQQLNIRQATISNIESGSANVSLDSLFRIMSALELEMHLESRDKYTVREDEALW